MRIFVLEDEHHADWQGQFVSLEDVVAELQRRSAIPWNHEPNTPPCMNWRKCRRRYEIIEYDDQAVPWTQIRRLGILEISADGVSWSGELAAFAPG